MFSFLLPFASKIISDAVSKIPDDAELGDKLIDICLVVLGKAVKMTKTTADDKLLETVNKMLGKKSGLSYCDARERYEHFRSRCVTEKPKIFNFKKTRKRKEKGCTEP